MHFVYIIQSEKDYRYYIGSTHELQLRSHRESSLVIRIRLSHFVPRLRSGAHSVTVGFLFFHLLLGDWDECIKR